MDSIDNLLSKGNEIFAANDTEEFDVEESEYLQEKEEPEKKLL